MEHSLPTSLQQAWDGYCHRYARYYGPLFKQRFDQPYEGHLLFACHAAFPGIVTPDLLYQIWFNFRVYPSLVEEGEDTSHGRMFAFPNFIVSDFLQSSLCQQVGYQQYAIDHELRAHLLDILRQDPRFGEARVQSLAALLEQYRKQQHKESYLSDLNQYHQWVARASLNPQSVARELGQQLADLVAKAQQDQSKLIEIRKMKQLLQDFSKTDKAFQDLADYSEVMDDYLIGKKVPAHRQVVLSSVPAGPGAVSVPFFTELRDKVGLGEKQYVRKPYEPGKNKVYALVVGINDYAADSIPNLQGSAKDALAMEAYLKQQFKGESLVLKTLIDTQATRENLIRGFMDHLATAGPGDVALFFFAGQGIQEEAIEAFWDLEQDHLLESLLPYDSGLTVIDQAPLAQREIDAMIWLLDKHKPNTVLIIDACHTGKDHVEFMKQASQANIPAVEESFNFEPQQQSNIGPEPFANLNVEEEQAEASEEEADSPQAFTFVENGPRGPREFLFCQLPEFGDAYLRLFEQEERIAALPEGAHVFLASGMSHEQAYEQSFEGEMRGVFSYMLLEELTNLQAPISNADLMARVQEKVRAKHDKQTPQLYVTGELKAEDVFLFGALEFKEKPENEALIRRLAEIIRPYNEQVAQKFEEAESLGEEIASVELIDLILEAFPWPISGVLRPFLINKSEANPIQARLESGFRLYQNLISLSLAILLTEFAQNVLQTSSYEPIEDTASHLRDLLGRTKASPLGENDQKSLMYLIGYLDVMDHPFLMKEWSDLQERMQENWYANEIFFQRWQAELERAISEEVDVDAFLIRLLEHGVNLLEPFAFLTGYEMQAVHEVEVQHQNQRIPFFIHNMTNLKVARHDQLETIMHSMAHSLDVHSVLYARNFKATNQTLNLTPYLMMTLDLELFVFSHIDTQASAYVFRSMISEQELRLSASENQSSAMLMKRFQEVLLPNDPSITQQVRL